MKQPIWTGCFGDAFTTEGPHAKLAVSEVTWTADRPFANRRRRRPERWFDVQNKWWILRSVQ